MSLKLCVKGDGSRWRETAGFSQLAATALYFHQDGKLTAVSPLKSFFSPLCWGMGKWRVEDEMILNIDPKQGMRTHLETVSVLQSPRLADTMRVSVSKAALGSRRTRTKNSLQNLHLEYFHLVLSGIKNPLFHIWIWRGKCKSTFSELHCISTGS